MNRKTRRNVRRRAVLVAGVALAALTFGVAGPAAADPIPFEDPSASGTIGFCDQSGHEITSGKIGAAPFAWTAVASVQAPAGYAAPKGRASLFVYQPIENVDPSNWSGKQMTAASAFTNTEHPMAQATVLDPALVDFVSVYPTHWDGLVQFRMFFSAPLQSPLTSSYPAAVVRVTGDTWTLVSGGHPACGSGTSISAETRALPASRFNVPTPRATRGATPASGAQSGSAFPNAAGHGGASSVPAGVTSGAGVVSGVSTTSASAKKAGRTSGSGGWWWLVIAAGGGGLLAWRIRRRRTA